jgi:hypothetical protein
MRSYCALKDQASVTWYLIVEATEMDPGAVFGCVSTLPVGADLAPTPTPSWIEVPGPITSPWYVYPSTTGAIVVSASAPALGTGFARPQGLALMDVERTLWSLGINESGDASGPWVPDGWLPQGWVPLGSGGGGGILAPKLVDLATFLIGLPQFKHLWSRF